jgi:hypothetical protein
MFFFSTAFDIGNGGPLQLPSADYERNNEEVRLRRASEENERRVP